MFKKQYEIIKNSPPGISWEDYESHILKEYKSLLQNCPEDEKVFQTFFEKYPCMVPGTFGMLGESGHWPFAATLISQPEIVGLTTKIPDFIWIASDSMTIYPVLIEIEAPIKKWFTSSGKPSEKFNQALNQLTEWKVWFSRPEHRRLFFDYYAVSSYFYESRNVIPLYVLIYGRRNEFENKPYLNEKRKLLEREHEFIMTYDRLKPNYKSRDLFCCKVKNRQYFAINAPATIQLGPMVAEDYAIINDKENAVSNNELISKERKEFLIKRIPYWDEFGRKEDKGTMSTSDFE